MDNNKQDTGEWGPCVSCKWWQIEPDAKAEPLTAGYCIEEQLQPFQLRITGNGGCNRFTEGEPARAKGSAEKPPMAPVTR
jgi:hypothetical protein